MSIDLTFPEIEQLKEILEDYHSELEMEVARTSTKNYREYLEKRDAFLEDLVHRLQNKLASLEDVAEQRLPV